MHQKIKDMNVLDLNEMAKTKTERQRTLVNWLKKAGSESLPSQL